MRCRSGVASSNDQFKVNMEVGGYEINDILWGDFLATLGLIALQRKLQVICTGAIARRRPERLEPIEDSFQLPDITGYLLS